MMERYEEAIAVSTEALKIAPGHVHSLQVRSSARMRLGDGEGALADIEAGGAAAPSPWWDNAKYETNKLIEIQGLLLPESVAAIEQYRKNLLVAIAGHLHGKCGYYRVPRYNETELSGEINSDLERYRDCIHNWYKTGDEELAASLSAEIRKNMTEFERAASLVKKGAGLQCSKMPKRSKCVTDAMYARAAAATSRSDHPKAIVGLAELDRLNSEVGAYNSGVKRHDAVINTANFFQSLARAMSEQ
jgi:hypothetical protein